MQQFRKGDIVSAEARVTYHSDDSDLVHLDLGGQSAILERSALSLVRLNVQPDDDVVFGHEDAVVIAVHETTAWVKCTGSGHHLVHVTDLKRKENGEEK